jgi:hypothetical protein
MAEEIKKEKKNIKIKDVITLEVNVNDLSSDRANLKILEEIEKQSLNDKIFLLKIKGTLSSGKTSDIDWKRISEKVTEKKAYTFLKSATGLSTKEVKGEADLTGWDCGPKSVHLFLQTINDKIFYSIWVNIPLITCI